MYPGAAAAAVALDRPAYANSLPNYPLSAVQIVFDDGAGRRELDVRVNVPIASVADLAHTLDATGAPTPRPLLIDGRRVDPDLGFREAGLHEGAVVRFADDSDRAAPSDDDGDGGDGGAVGLAIVNGLDAGRRFGLPPGRTVLGRAPSCEVVLGHGTVSQRHAAVTRSAAGAVRVEDLDSHNGTWLAGTAVTGATDLPAGVPLRVGALELELRPHDTSDRPRHLDPSRHTSAAGTIAFNRPPRTVAPPPAAQVTLPQPPRSGSGKGSLSVASIVAPLVIAGASFAIMKSPQYLLFAGLSPLMAIGNAIESRRRGRRTERSEKERFRRELRELDERLASSAVAERDRRRAAYPDPVEIMRRVTLPSTTLWERRPDHADYLQLRIGTGDVAWEPPVVERRGVPPADEVAEALRAASRLERTVVPVELADGGVVGIVGDRDAALALARSLLCQIAVLHGPADVPTMVLTTPAAGADWDWAKWLPHTRGASGVDRMLSSRPDLSTRMVEARLEAAGATNGRRRPSSASASGEARSPQGPTLLVVVDDEALTAGRRAPTRNLLRGDGGAVAGIVIAASADRLPALCTAVITMDGPDGTAHLLLPKLGTRVDSLLACGLSDATARDCARTLACYEDPELDLVGAGLPGSIRLLPLLDLDPCTPEAIRARWARAGASPTEVAAPIGATESGVFTVDLVADGPHGLVGGTTGAGKSELLRTMVAGLATGLDPDHLTFLLIDFKGGSAFDECAKLPHTVGIVTDLDEHLAERALRCLEAELKFRERTLRDAGAVDLPDYLRSTAALPSSAPAPPLPRLIVIIDEFATLKAELPQFVDALVGVAQRGRSLGVHLLLATQRPQGAVSENIKANTNLRIALRVQDRSDSTDIIDVADAAAIPRTAPGRAYVRLGPGEVAAIQTALSTGAHSDDALQPVDVAAFVYGPLPRAPAPAPAPGDTAGAGEEGETDLTVLVAAISGAFEASGRPPPRRPWPDPLPGDVDLDDVIALAAATADGPPRFVPLAMADDPDAQTQYPTGWVPEHGNLVAYGIGGSGGTTLLTTLALSLARRHGADDVHLYGLDFGARELEALAPLPHVGAIVTAAERERQTRLVRYLRDELARRRQAGLASVGEEPMLVLLIDGWSALAAEYNDVAGGPALEALQRIVADGPEVRIYTIITADRPNAVPASVASSIRQRLALRLADASAYTLFGIRSTAVPEMLPGRALVGGTGQVVQIARPAGGVAAAVASIVAATPLPAPARAPRPIRTLGNDIRLADLGDAAAALGARPWTIPVGIAEETLSPASLVVYQGEHALVAGPARSGKTTALLTVAAVCRVARPDLTVLAVAGPRSALSYDDLVDEVIAPTAIGTDLAARVEAAAATAGATLLLVDDAEAVDDAGDTLVGLTKSDRADLLVVVAGRNDGVRSGYTHWTRQLRRSKLGILLMPDVDYDADLLGTPIPRRPPVPITPGRGYLVNTGHATLVHLARPG